MACYSGDNPVTDDERIGIWRWAMKNGIDDGLSYENVSDAINGYFFAGHAPQAWIADILTGPKSLNRHLTNELWRARYNRRIIVQQADDFSKMQAMGEVGKIAREIWTFPRAVETFGHWGVFMWTHAGELAFRPQSWDIFYRGLFNSYKGAFSKAETEKVLNYMERRALFETAMRSKLDVGPKSRPSGLINRYYEGPSRRAWDMLTVARYELWEREMKRTIEPDMTEAEVLEIGQKLAPWANHATGSAGGMPKQIAPALFGPKLTASKLARLSVDPIDTVKTYANWDRATPGEKAVARARLSGGVQWVVTRLGFLAANQGLLMALGLNKEEDQINWKHPMKSDWMAFKLGGLDIYVPGLQTEIRTVAKIVATGFMTNKELRGKPRQMEVGGILAQYGMAKLTPTLGRLEEFALGQDYRGRPVPWRPDLATPKKPPLTWPEYLGSIGPIPLEGPTGYFYDHLKKAGASPMDATAIVKGFIIAGLGWMGLRVQEEPQPAKSR